MGIEKFRRKSVFPAINLNGIDLYGAMGLPAIQGKVYYVEGNVGLDTQDGLSWDKAKKTLASAITASNASIANADEKGYASRNTIFVKGDRLDEDLVIFPNKCDVIGVGSCDAYIGAGIIGNHAPVNAANYGTRFINVNFFPDANGDIITIASTSSGVQFINCVGIGVWGTKTAPSFIDITASPMAKILNCKMFGAFSGDVIDVGAGDASGMEIVGNKIVGGADNGIVITGVATVSGAMSRGIIAHNEIEVADKVIDTRAVSVFNCHSNICISGESNGAGAYVIDPTYAVDNKITCADTCIIVPTYSELTTT